MPWSARESPQGSRDTPYKMPSKKIIRDAFKTALIHVTLEPSGLLRNDGRRPDGTRLTPWQGGKPIAWDFTCVNRIATSNISSGKQEGLVSANIAEDRKSNNYRQLETFYYFEPVAIEILGGIGETSYNFLKELSRRIDAKAQEKRCFLFLRQRLGIAVQRHLCA